MIEQEAARPPVRCLFSRDGLPACAAGPCATCDILSVFDRVAEAPQAAPASPDLAVHRIERYRPVSDGYDWIEGNGTGEMRGLIAMYAEPYEPTPIERALDILRPHLASVPFYRRTAASGQPLPLPSTSHQQEARCPRPTPAHSPTPKPAPCSCTSTGCR